MFLIYLYIHKFVYFLVSWKYLEAVTPQHQCEHLPILASKWPLKETRTREKSLNPGLGKENRRWAWYIILCQKNKEVGQKLITGTYQKDQRASFKEAPVEILSVNNTLNFKSFFLVWYIHSLK